MKILWRIWILIAACSIQVWAESLKYYDGSVGDRQVEFRLEWGENGNVKGDYFHTVGNRAHYKLLGNNKTEGVLEFDVYSGEALTAKMALTKKTQDKRIYWVGTLKSNDAKSLAVSFSRQSEKGAAQAPDVPSTQVSGIVEGNQSGSGEKAVKDTTNGALVWRPYLGNVQWSGGVNDSGFADGKGTLVVFDRKGNRAAVFTGTMKEGHLVGALTAMYPTSSDRAHYVGGYSNWAENGIGTMTYNDGKVVSGIWEKGELVSTKAAGAAEIQSQIAEPAPHAERENAVIEPPDPDTAAEDLQQTYDNLKGKLQKDALQNLKICQRAWIKYNETALKISSDIWDKPNDPWEGADRFDALMAWQRTRELQFITKSLFDPISDDSLTDSLDDQVAILSGQLRQIHANGHIKANDIATLKQHWDQSCQLANLADAKNQLQNQKGHASRHLLALATRNLNEILALWIPQPKEIAVVPSLPSEVIQPMVQPKPEIAGESGNQKLETTDSANPHTQNPQLSHTDPQKMQHTADTIKVRDPVKITEATICDGAENISSPDQVIPKKTANSLSETQLLNLIYGVLAVLSIIALVGVFMGVNEKITIYNGNWDLVLTCLCAISVIAAWICFTNDNTPIMVLFIITAFITLLMSFRESMMANDSVLRAALAVPAKFILLVLIASCGLMAYGNVRSGMDEIKKGNKDKAASLFLIAAVFALGARFFYNLIKKLIKERVTRKIQPLSIAE